VTWHTHQWSQLGRWWPMASRPRAPAAKPAASPAAGRSGDERPQAKGAGGAARGEGDGPVVCLGRGRPEARERGGGSELGHGGHGHGVHGGRALRRRGEAGDGCDGCGSERRRWWCASLSLRLDKSARTTVWSRALELGHGGVHGCSALERPSAREKRLWAARRPH
jgi:hypothetical protein